MNTDNPEDTTNDPIEGRAMRERAEGEAELIDHCINAGLLPPDWLSEPFSVRLKERHATAGIAQPHYDAPTQKH